MKRSLKERVSKLELKSELSRALLFAIDGIIQSGEYRHKSIQAYEAENPHLDTKIINIEYA